MKQFFAVILIIILAFSIIGCGAVNQSVQAEDEIPSRFKTVEVVEEKALVTHIIIVDTETNVMYLWRCVGSGTARTSGLAALLNEDGTPMIWEGE
jgi:hypothetical protein